MEEITPATPPSPPENTKLTKEQRSQIMRDAAKRRWAKAKKTAAKAKQAAPPVKAKTATKGQKVSRPQKYSGPREFSTALKAAEKRLAKALEERAFHAAKYAVVSAEIPSLQSIILALRNPAGTISQQYYSIPVAPPTLEQIVGDQSLSYQNPPRPAPSPVPPLQHPVTTAGRAMGGAIGVELAEVEDEDRFLKESGVADGSWH